MCVKVYAYCTQECISAVVVPCIRLVDAGKGQKAIKMRILKPLSIFVLSQRLNFIEGIFECVLQFSVFFWVVFFCLFQVK